MRVRIMTGVRNCHTRARRLNSLLVCIARLNDRLVMGTPPTRERLTRKFSPSIERSGYPSARCGLVCRRRLDPPAPRRCRRASAAVAFLVSGVWSLLALLCFPTTTDTRGPLLGDLDRVRVDPSYGAGTMALASRYSLRWPNRVGRTKPCP